MKNEGARLPLVDYEDEENSLIRARKWGAIGSTLTDAISVARFYMEVSFLYCAVVGSTLAKSPHSRSLSRYHLEIERDTDTVDMHKPEHV